MERDIFLLSNKSKFSTNKDSYVNVNLVGDKRLVPSTEVANTVNLFDLYNEERDNCTKFRLIFNINPICTNVCFNNVTEIVKNEGSNFCAVIKNTGTAPTRYDCIRNTMYSHDDISGYTYHCGADIFNNHILRSKDFTHCARVGSNNGKYFNTIDDIVRDENGNEVKELPFNASDSKDVPENRSIVHIYNSDNVMSLFEAFDENCTSRDGWYGFENKTLIDIPNVYKGNKAITVNSVINNQNPCSFVDLYPDRTLFSFVPKYNEHRNRAEYNWDYCLTYPYRNDKDKFNEINKNTLNAAIIHEAKYKGGQIEFKCLMKHTLEKGSYVTLYYTDRLGTNDIKKYYKTVRVHRVGDTDGNDTEHIFSVKFNDVSATFALHNDTDIIIKGGKKAYFFYKKSVNGVNCEYYFRIFKKYTGVEITSDGQIVERQPRSEINKLAFAKNIFGDNVSQIIYTDDIDIDGLVDNLGRPISEMYLTIVKNNRGFREWYYNNNYTSDKVEYSHAFGKVTSGVDMPSYVTDYNVNKLHNLVFGRARGAVRNTEDVYKNLAYKPTPIEGGNDVSGITIDYEEFYGDIVEFSPSEYRETTIENVLHRVNTAQREFTGNLNYSDIFEDVIDTDDYYGANNDMSQRQSVKTNVNVAISGNSEVSILGNVNPEGYVYRPHFKIKLRETSDVLSSVSAKYINYDGSVTKIKHGNTVDDGLGRPLTDENGDVYYFDALIIDSPEDYDVSVGEIISIYDLLTTKTIWGSITEVNGSKLTIAIDENTVKEQQIKDNGYIVSIMDGICPTYAKFVPNLDEYVWRNYVEPSKMFSGMQLFDTPFSNGAFYLHKNVNFFMRRQDPYGENYLSNPEDNPDGALAISQNSRKLQKRRKDKYDFNNLKILEDLFKYTCD